MSCKKYLDAKPNQQQVVPSTLQDLQALLDNVLVMNRSFSGIGEAAADNYYVTLTDYNALVTAEDKSLYIWQPDGVLPNGQWLASYQVVYYANQVLESLEQIAPAPTVQSQQIRGAALFFRAYAFFQLASVFSKPYYEQTAGNDSGIPIRLTADFNPVSVRSTNQQTYDRILADFKEAVPLLPQSSTYPSQPTKSAAYAVLARTYLAMGQYQMAGTYADSCLSLQPQLINFNTLSATSANPIARFNKETIFYAMSGGSTLLVPSRCKIDSTLYASYATNDLRRTIYFKSNNNGSYAFKGNYDGSQSATIFSGLATDEIYLIRAECYARAGQTAKALSDLNTLLQTRWKTGTFQPLQVTDASAALALILNERRKELIFRALRWTDLRRLNQEADLRITLKRNLGSALYQLPPQDLRYVFLIPQEVITTSGIAQNPR
ncbi:RagB/SusD family nutrient uptake outer membrane protein [Mucilaginibacter sp. PAMB04274]|uniref:RagB/SusD family nutrient uptake outer membrane protein n=1 Tax=Mucilaginibacter sp. PAMB04274 TaxID=3138568 RepID=UPI0031F6135E